MSAEPLSDERIEAALSALVKANRIHQWDAVSPDSTWPETIRIALEAAGALRESVSPRPDEALRICQGCGKVIEGQRVSTDLNDGPVEYWHPDCWVERDELAVGVSPRSTNEERIAALEAVAHPPVGFELCGYFRFIESDKPGVVGEVISVYSEGWADESDVPVYRVRGETKASLAAGVSPPSPDAQKLADALRALVDADTKFFGDEEEGDYPELHNARSVLDDWATPPNTPAEPE